MKSRVSRTTIAVATTVLLLAAVQAHAEWNKGLEAYKQKDWATAVKEFAEVTKTIRLAEGDSFLDVVRTQFPITEAESDSALDAAFDRFRRDDVVLLGSAH